MQPNFTPLWVDAEQCPNCHEEGMPKWQEAATARRCANCGHVEEKTDAVKTRIE